MLQEVGLNPYNVEAFSCYLSGSQAERGFLQQAENTGISETLCSYHKTFLGAAQKGVLPKPKCIVYTNLTCDANLLTFRTLSQLYHVQPFAIDVPMQQNEDNVEYVAAQLRALASFLEQQTGRTIDEEALKERLRRSKRTPGKIPHLSAEAGRPVCAYRSGDAAVLRYDQQHPAGHSPGGSLCGRAAERCGARPPPPKASASTGCTPSPSGRTPSRRTCSSGRTPRSWDASSAKCPSRTLTPSTPYEAMAHRMVYHALNGSAVRRIEAGIRHAKQVKADGVVWFDHWGCKHTLGAAQLAKKEV